MYLLSATPYSLVAISCAGCAVEKRFINFKTRFIDKENGRWEREGIYRRGEKAAKVNINIYKVSPRIAFTWALELWHVIITHIMWRLFFLSLTLSEKEEMGRTWIFLMVKTCSWELYNLRTMLWYSMRQCWWILKLLYLHLASLFVKMNFIITEAALHTI